LAAPSFTIITASLNRAPMLAEAIASVEEQGVADIEHIIVDGGSTDGTAELLARHPALRVIREPDRSVYDAFNKGLRMATGKVIALLNSDDLFAPGALAAVAKEFENPDVDVVTGAAEIFAGANVVEKIDDPGERRLEWGNITLGNPLPNARFYRRALVEQTGEFDIRYRLASDRDWLLRMLRKGAREAVIPMLVYRYRRHGESLTINDHSRLAEPLWRESLAIAEEWLSRTDLAEGERETLRAWRRHQCIEASLHFLRHGPWSKTAEFMRRGANDPLWMGEWVRGLGKATVGFLSRR
jgi:glycosyltransferase involved in cell wall biosynthesis